MDDWDDLVGALEALIGKGDAMTRRIEELEAKLALMERKCATLYEGWRISDHSRIDAEAKLAKAVKALAELKGQNDE